jgi:transposase
MKTSGDSELRVVRSCTLPESSPSRVFGVDAWAYRRGHGCGTLICDLESHRPIDLLPDRSTESFQNWLSQPVGIEVISRDRGDCYASGATAGAPKAIQVADRWPLLRNLSDTLQRMVDRHPRQIAEVWQAAFDGRPLDRAGAFRCFPVKNSG